MASVPPVRELETDLRRRGPRPRRAARLPDRLRACWCGGSRSGITWLLLHTRLSANSVTLLGILIGIAGALMLAWNEFWPLVAGLVLLQLSFVVDYSDGEVARYRAHERGHGDRRGRRLPRLDRPLLRARDRDRRAGVRRVHRERPRLAAAGRAGGDPERRAGRRTRRATTCCSACSATGRSCASRPSSCARCSPARAATPSCSTSRPTTRAAAPAPPARGLLWRRWTNLGQVLVFPGFVNLLLRVRRDRPRRRAALDGDYPAVAQIAGPRGADRATGRRAPRPSGPCGCAGLPGPAAARAERAAARARSRAAIARSCCSSAHGRSRSRTAARR